MSYLSDWWNFRKLKRVRRELRKSYAEQFKQYRTDKSKTADDYNALQAEEYYEGQATEEAVNKFLSNRLLEQATEYDIETPPISEEEFWQYTHDGEYYYLSVAGRALVRRLIHTERERSFEEWARWARTFAPIIAAIAGLVGVLIGLASVLKK